MKKLSLSIIAVLLILGAGIPAMGANLFEGVDIHGVISQGFLASEEYNYLSHKSKDGSFEYNEMGLNFGKQLTNKLGLGVQFFARDLGDVGNNKVTLDWAYGDYRIEDWLGVRFGRVKLPLGLWNEVRDFDILRPWIVLPQGVYRDLSRDVLVANNGVGVYGNIAAGGAGNFDYLAVVGNPYPDPSQGTGKYLEDNFKGQMEVTGEGSSRVSYSGSLRWNTPLPGLMIGVWGLTALSKQRIQSPDGSITGEMNIDFVYMGGMAEYSWNNLSLWAEYNQQDADVETDINTSAGVFTRAQSITPESSYLGLAYRFVDWFQLGTYYHLYYADMGDRDGSNQAARGNPDHKGWEKDFALTFRFDINEYWIFKLEGHSVNGTANVVFMDNADSDYSEDNFYYGAAKLSVSF